MLENRDFERFGAYSRYTLVNREYAQQPDTYIARFASSILWDPDTPYDYDIDYYTPDGAAMAAGYASWPMCSSLYRHFNGFGPGYRLTYALYDWDMWDWWGGALSPLAACGTYYNTLRCISVISAFGVPCAPYGGTIAVLPPVVAGPVTEGTPVPNEGVVRGGLDTPTPLPVPVATGEATHRRWNAARRPSTRRFAHRPARPSGSRTCRFRSGPPGSSRPVRPA